MTKYYIKYYVTVEAEDIDEAVNKAYEIENDIAGLKYVKAAYADNYVETEQ